jgi:hypothetical protein
MKENNQPKPNKNVNHVLHYQLIQISSKELLKFTLLGDRAEFFLLNIELLFENWSFDNNQILLKFNQVHLTHLSN